MNLPGQILMQPCAAGIWRLTILVSFGCILIRRTEYSRPILFSGRCEQSNFLFFHKYIHLWKYLSPDDIEGHDHLPGIRWTALLNAVHFTSNCRVALIRSNRLIAQVASKLFERYSSFLFRHSCSLVNLYSSLYYLWQGQCRWSLFVPCTTIGTIGERYEIFIDAGKPVVIEHVASLKRRLWSRYAVLSALRLIDGSLCQYHFER